MRWLQNAAGALVISGFVYYLWAHRTELSAILNLSAVEVGVLVLLVFATWVLNAAQGYILYRTARVKIGFLETFLLSSAANFGNYLPGRAGTLVRAHYLNSLYDLRYVRFGSIVTVRAVLTIISAGFAGLSGILWLALLGHDVSLQLTAIFLGLVLAPSLVFFWPRNLRTSNPVSTRFGRAREDFTRGFLELSASPRAGLAVIALLLLQYLTLGVRFFIAANLTSATISLPVFALLAPLAGLASFISLTPGALGLREAIMGYISFAVGASFSEGVFVGTLDRAVLLFVAAILGGPCFVWIWVRVRRTP
jgi:uncharacterized membrane protein YbhN (UPF0104 family)